MMIGILILMFRFVSLRFNQISGANHPSSAIAEHSGMTDHADHQTKRPLAGTAVKGKRRTSPTTPESVLVAGASTEKSPKRTKQRKESPIVKQRRLETPLSVLVEGTPEPKRPGAAQSRSSRKKREVDIVGVPPSETNESESVSKEQVTRSIESDGEATNEMDTESEGDENENTESVVDVVIHRLRHLEYRPHAVVSMRATRIKDNNIVAVSRQNGSIELRSLNNKMRTLSTIMGSKDGVANAMAWIGLKSRKTLIGGSANGSIFIVNWENQLVSSVTSSGGGGIFCLDTLCEKSTHPYSEFVVAAGCEDGAIRFFELSDGVLDVLSASTIPSAGAPVTSCSWVHYRGQPMKGKLVGSTMFAGIADGTIRRYDWKDENWSSTLRMTVECYGRPIPTKVWQLRALSDGSLVSGDSLGHIQFWDGNTGAIVTSFNHNTRKADVLDLDVSKNQLKVFASGVDARVVCIERDRSGVDSPWTLSNVQRAHTHDVCAVVVSTKKKSFQQREVIITGGVDTLLCTYNANNFANADPASYYPWPCKSLVHVAKHIRVMCFQRESRLDFYKLASEQPEPVTDIEPIRGTHFLGSIEVHDTSNIVLSSISPDGTIAFACNSSSVFLFRLFYDEGSPGNIRSERIPMSLPSGTHVVAARLISSDRLVVVNETGTLHGFILREDELHEVGCTGREASPNRKFWGLPVDTLLVSADQRWLVTISYTIDSCASVEVYRNNDEAGFTHWWTIPSSSAPISSARILEGKKARLMMVTTGFLPSVINIEDKSFSRWEPTNVSADLQRNLLDRQDFPFAIAQSPKFPNVSFLVSEVYMWGACRVYSQHVCLQHMPGLSPLLQQASNSPTSVFPTPLWYSDDIHSFKVIPDTIQLGLSENSSDCGYLEAVSNRLFLFSN